MAGTSKSTANLQGPDDYETLQAASGDVVPTRIFDSTCLWIDVAGIIKIDYDDKDGNSVTEVFDCPAKTYVLKQRISKLYRYYTGTTQGTATSLHSDGLQKTNAIKIYRVKS